MTRKFTAYVEWDPEVNCYTAIVPSVPGAHTQGASLDELRVNLRDVLTLCIDENQIEPNDLPQFVGILQVEAD